MCWVARDCSAARTRHLPPVRGRLEEAWMDMTGVDEAISHNRLAEAIALLGGVPKGERDLALWARLGDCYSKVGDWARASEALEEAHKLDCGDRDVLSGLFRAYFFGGRLFKARQCHRLCVRASVPGWKLLEQRACLLICRGKLTQARAAWTEAASQCPDALLRAWVFWQAATTLMQYQHAEEALEVLPDADVGREGWLMLRAAVYSKLGMAEDLAKVVDEATDNGYSFPSWPRYKAELALLAGDPEKGVALLEERAKAHPGNAPYLAMLADYLQRIGQGDRAVEYARQADRIRPKDMQVLRTVIQVLKANGRYLEALGLTRRR